MASLVENQTVVEVDLVDKISQEESGSADKETIKLEDSESNTIDQKHKKKLDKLIDSVLKRSKSSQPISIEEKYYALAQKFFESQEQSKKSQLNVKETEKTIGNLTKQRDQAQTDYAKVLLVKTKLESLCRELQKQNKLVKEASERQIQEENKNKALQLQQQIASLTNIDESLQRIEDEEKKRKEISAKFQSAIDEINQQVSSNSEKNNTLIQENVQLSTKLKTLIEQYEVREQHIEKVLKHKDLEIQLANAKLQQSELKLAELGERVKKEKVVYENHCAELMKKCEFHQEAENQLRSQLTLYTQKYEEFQGTLTKSNQIFESFRTEMDKMTKKIKKLEQETSQWKNKWETCNTSLQSVLKKKDEMEEKSKKMETKADLMEQISRSLQTERSNLKQQVKELEEKLKAFKMSEENKAELVESKKVEAEIKEETKTEEIIETVESKKVEAEIKEETKTEEIIEAVECVKVEAANKEETKTIEEISETPVEAKEVNETETKIEEVKPEPEKIDAPQLN